MRYVALLRGVNVGGNNKVPMKDLKECFEKAGFFNVLTYINSGNVVFDSEETSIEKLAAKCRSIVEQNFGLAVPLALIDAPAMKDALDHAPVWWDQDPESRHNALFVIPPANADEVCAGVGPIRPEYEKVASYQSIIFWSAQIKTISRTRWSKIVGTKSYQDVTIRNANTTKKLLAFLLNHSQ